MWLPLRAQGSILSATFFKNTVTDIQPLTLTAYLGVPDDVSRGAGFSKGSGEKEVGYISSYSEAIAHGCSLYQAHEAHCLPLQPGMIKVPGCWSLLACYTISSCWVPYAFPHICSLFSSPSSTRSLWVCHYVPARHWLQHYERLERWIPSLGQDFPSNQLRRTAIYLSYW